MGVRGAESGDDGGVAVEDPPLLEESLTTKDTKEHEGRLGHPDCVRKTILYPRCDGGPVSPVRGFDPAYLTCYKCPFWLVCRDWSLISLSVFTAGLEWSKRRKSTRPSFSTPYKSCGGSVFGIPEAKV